MNQTTQPTPAVPSARSRVRNPRALEMTPPASKPVAVVSKEVVTTIPAEWQDLARTYHFEGKVMNTAKSASEKARAKLYADMAAAGVKSFSFETTTPSGAPCVLNVALATPSAQYIDAKTLLDLVGQEKFLEIVTASKKAVEDAVGGNIAAQCLRSGFGKENVKVAVEGEK